MAKKKKEENNKKQEGCGDETCPDCGKKSKPIIDVFEGKHFTVWGNDDFITINFYFNDITVTCPSDLWAEMRSDFQVIGMLPVPYSDENGTSTPESLN